MTYEEGDEINPDLCLTHQEAQLRAVDLTIEQARKHRDFLQKKHGQDLIGNMLNDKPTDLTRFFRIESCSANHLFASSQLGTLKRINKRKEL